MEPTAPVDQTPTPTPAPETTDNAAPANNDAKPESPQQNQKYEVRIPQNTVNISASITPQSWGTRIRSILKFHETATLGALGQAMLTLTDTVETLKRDQVAVVKSITTSQIEIDIGNRKVNKAKLNVVLERGPNALLLSGYRRRRVLGLFDELYQKQSETSESDSKTDSFDSPEDLKIDSVSQLDFSGFESDSDSKAKSSQYVDDIHKSKPAMNAIEFLTYISFLVSPKLTNSAFDGTINNLSNRSR